MNAMPCGKFLRSFFLKTFFLPLVPVAPLPGAADPAFAINVFPDLSLKATVTVSRIHSEANCQMQTANCLGLGGRFLFIGDRSLARAFACARVGVRALSADR